MKFTLLVLALVGAANACRFPPSLWCDSKEIALECKVYDQCKQWVWRQDLQAPLVNFELYYESLCPDCQLLITQQLLPTYSKIGSIMNVTLVPYGNAHERKVGDKWMFKCQHGEEECNGNMLETCAMHVLRDMNKIVPFITCIESSEYSFVTAVKRCAERLGAPLDPILSCYNSSEGSLLEHQMALKTAALVPKHKWVPWVVLNGFHSKDIDDAATDDLLTLICNTYTGPKPKACLQPENY